MNDKAPRFTVTLVHGTGARGAAWTKKESSLLWCELENRFKEAIFVDRFDWSGDNNMFARIVDAWDLVEHLQWLKKEFPAAKHFIVAHSHGGNVALYAAELTAVDGIVCLATPFISASVRDPALLSIYAIGYGITELLFLITLAVYTIFGPHWFIWLNDSWWGWLAFAVGGSLLAAVLAGSLSKIVDIALRTAPAFVARITARVPYRTQFCAFRVAGDEASMVLASGELLAWASNRVYAYFAAAGGEGLRLRKPLRRMRFSTHVFFGIMFIAALGLMYIGFVEREHVIVFAVISIILFVAIVCTYSTLLDDWFRGIGFLLLAISSWLVIYLTGTIAPDWITSRIPPDQFPDAAVIHRRVPLIFRWAIRLVIGLGYAMVLDIHMEAAPPGSWQLYQFGKRQDTGKRRNWDLSHSIYNHPDVRTQLVNWLDGVAS